jgi:hypothetical protein
MGVLISFLDGVSAPDDLLEEAVARNASNDAYFVNRAGYLLCVPDTLVYKTLKLEIEAELPRLAHYLEEHQSEVEEIDLDLWHQYSNPERH